MSKSRGHGQERRRGAIEQQIASPGQTAIVRRDQDRLLADPCLGVIVRAYIAGEVAQPIATTPLGSQPKVAANWQDIQAHPEAYAVAIARFGQDHTVRLVVLRSEARAMYDDLLATLRREVSPWVIGAYDLDGEVSA